VVHQKIKVVNPVKRTYDFSETFLILQKKINTI
jgi:hypothetical protein